MIRQEFLVEKMKADLEDTKQQVLESLVNLKNEREKFADDIKRKTDDIEVLKENMKEARDLVKAQIETNIKDNRAELEKIRDSVVTPAIAFKANTVTETRMSDNKVFIEKLFDTGNAYNKQTGIFVAPVSGIYYFSVQLCISGGHHCSITINDVGISRTVLEKPEGTKCYTMDALTSAEKGDKVSVICAYYCSSDTLWEYAHATSSFSGVLLHKQR